MGVKPGDSPRKGEEWRWKAMNEEQHHIKSNETKNNNKMKNSNKMKTKMNEQLQPTSQKAPWRFSQAK